MENKVLKSPVFTAELAISPFPFSVSVHCIQYFIIDFICASDCHLLGALVPVFYRSLCLPLGAGNAEDRNRCC